MRSSLNLWSSRVEQGWNIGINEVSTEVHDIVSITILLNPYLCFSTKLNIISFVALKSVKLKA